MKICSCGYHNQTSKTYSYVSWNEVDSYLGWTCYAEGTNPCGATCSPGPFFSFTNSQHHSCKIALQIKNKDPLILEEAAVKLRGVAVEVVSEEHGVAIVGALLLVHSFCCRTMVGVEYSTPGLVGLVSSDPTTMMLGSFLHPLQSCPITHIVGLITSRSSGPT